MRTVVKWIEKLGMSICCSQPNLMGMDEESSRNVSFREYFKCNTHSSRLFEKMNLEWIDCWLWICAFNRLDDECWRATLVRIWTHFSTLLYSYSRRIVLTTKWNNWVWLHSPDQFYWAERACIISNSNCIIRSHTHYSGRFIYANLFIQKFEASGLQTRNLRRSFSIGRSAKYLRKRIWIAHNHKKTQCTRNCR
jgi:hypothetical protein